MTSSRNPWKTYKAGREESSGRTSRNDVDKDGVRSDHERTRRNADGVHDIPTSICSASESSGVDLVMDINTVNSDYVAHEHQ
jgi:hypothetical protein